MKIDADTLVSVPVLALVLGMSERRVAQCVAENIIPPPVAKGKYLLVASVNAYIAWQRDDQRRHTKSAAQSRVADARAREIEIRTAERERELIPLTDALAHTNEVIGGMVARLEGLPAAFTRDLGERRKLETLIDAIRTDVADRAAKYAAAMGSERVADQAVAADDAG